MKQVWQLFSDGKLSKADLEKILRLHHAACDEMDSGDRQRSDAFEKALAGNDDLLKDIYGGYYDGFINSKQLERALKMHRNGIGRADIKKFFTKCGIGK